MRRLRSIFVPLALAAGAGCASPGRTARAPAPTTPTAAPRGIAVEGARAIRRDIPVPSDIRRAYARGTRDSSGAPAARYWQQRVDYSIDAALDPSSATVRGTERVTIHNQSPDTLRRVGLRLYQNYFRAAAQRNDYITEVTDGIVLERFAVNGAPIQPPNPPLFDPQPTVTMVPLPAPVAPGQSATLDVAWHFRVPLVPEGQRGERMGRWGTDLFQVAQWYPQVAMYDDVHGWFLHPYLGSAEFYNEFGSFDVRVTVPAGWLVGATGTLVNADEVLTPAARDRLALALRADSTVHVVGEGDRGPGRATVAGTNGTLTWHFTAPRVADFAFMTSPSAVWDAGHAALATPVLVNALYLPKHGDFADAVPNGRFALEATSRLLEPYAFPQLTIVDGPETGMEYPMIIFSDPDFGTVAHETVHEWFPMTVGTNESWYGWMDEGMNEWLDPDLEALHERRAVVPPSAGPYLAIAGTEIEPPLMWPSDYAGPAYVIQAYRKPPIVMRALGGVVGDSAAHAAFADFVRAWSFRHPTPWDFFFFLQRRLGQDLGWFWNAWFFTTGTFAQRVVSVTPSGQTATITVADDGDIPMPVIARVELAGGDTLTVRAPASVWFGGSRTTTVTVNTSGRAVTRVVLDPERRFPRS